MFKPRQQPPACVGAATASRSTANFLLARAWLAVLVSGLSGGCASEQEDAQPSLLLAREAAEAQVPCGERRRVYLYHWHGQHVCGWVAAYRGARSEVEVAFHGRLPVRLEGTVPDPGDRDAVLLATLGVYGLPLIETPSAGEVSLGAWPSEGLDEIRDPDSGWLVGAWLPSRQLAIDWVASECLDDATSRTQLKWPTFARALALRAVTKSESCRRDLYQGASALP